ncbi:hypothetical protein T484DRAFT_1768801 [Baffinella frigidus]|nr:hypothetical protein T484DRAFT_1768801 [Cryptophyta sp. CCMP2293]
MSNFRNERLLAAGLLGLAVVVLVAVPVLERSRGGEVVLRDKCDADCQQKAEMVQEQMKALRAQITGDYKSMVTFGTKVGYVPPPQSIRKEVMDGTLLGTGKGPAEPGDFDPTATVSPSASRGRKHKSFGSDAEKKLLASEEPSSVGGERSSSILPPVKTLAQTEASLMKSTPAAHGADSDSDSDSGDSFLKPAHSQAHASSSGGGGGTWAKDFSFMGHHKVGGEVAHHHHSSHHSEGGARGLGKESAVVRRAMAKALHIST